MSNVEVTLKYHPMTHHLFLAILCLITVFDDYLSIVSITYSLPITDWVAMATWWQLSSYYKSPIGITVSLHHLSRVYSEALEPLAIDQSSSQWLVRPTRSSPERLQDSLNATLYIACRSILLADHYSLYVLLPTPFMYIYRLFSIDLQSSCSVNSTHCKAHSSAKTEARGLYLLIKFS